VTVAALSGDSERGRALALFGYDIDHTPDSSGAVKRSARPSQNLNPFDTFRGQVGKIEAPRCHAVDLYTIDQYQNLI
jgi:hypothetical protein